MPIADGLVAFTVTPGSTALLVSLTRPLIDPVVLAPPPCAKAAAGAITATHTIAATTNANPRFIRTPPRICDATIPIQRGTIANAEEDASFHPRREAGFNFTAHTVRTHGAHCVESGNERCAEIKKGLDELPHPALSTTYFLIPIPN